MDKPAVCRKEHVMVVSVALLLAIVAYSSALGGDFVYDDDIEIVANPYIQHGQFLWKALTSDVWAFKGERSQPWSNYWRPLFVAWMAMNYRFFGLETTGWHVTSLIAHLVVIALVYSVLVRLHVRRAVCIFVTWVFAAHPVHVESVAWASGIPDILMSAFVLSSYLCFLSARTSGSRARWIWALTFLALALLCKEGAIVFPMVVFCSDWVMNAPDQGSGRDRLWRSFHRAVPFLAVAVVFVLVRYQVLGTMRMLAPQAPSLGSVLLSAPGVAMFYARQIVFPLELGPVYGVRAVGADSWSAWNLIIPLLVMLALGCAMLRCWVSGRTEYRFGCIWLLLPIALAFDIRVFLPEQLVHDRYLYLPLFGALLLLGGALADLAARVVRQDARRASRSVVVASLVVSVLLGALTWNYNSVWSDNIALWERGVRVDEASAYAHAELGEQYRRAGRVAEAKRELQRTLAINSGVTNAHVALGMIAISEKRYAEAERWLRGVLDIFPNYTVALEQLALTYRLQGMFDAAASLFDGGRRRMPYKNTIYTINIAVLHKLAGRDADALAELQSITDSLDDAVDHRQLKGWWYLGQLYDERGQFAQSVAAFDHYLRATDGITIDEVRLLRGQAQVAVRRMRDRIR